MSDENVLDISERLRESQNELDSMLSNGPGGPGGGDMEIRERLRSLESSALQAAVDIAGMKSDIRHLPTKDFITTRLVLIVGGFAAVTSIVTAVVTALIN